MAIHLVAAHESVDQALGNITWLNESEGEQLMLIDSGDNDNLRPRQGFVRIVGAYVGAPTAEVARFNSPHLRRVTTGRYLTPLSTTVEPGSPPAWVDLRSTPIEVKENEPLNLQVENDGAGAAETVVGLVWFSDGGTNPVAPSAKSFWTRATGSTTVTADQWSGVATTLDNDLEEGTYKLLGVVGIGATMVGWRVRRIADNHRPGGLAMDAVSDLIGHQQPWANGGLGVLETFEHDEPPTIEVLCDAADTSQEFLFLLDPA